MKDLQNWSSIENVKRKNHLALTYDIERVDIFNGEVKHNVYVKRQRRICTMWLSFPFTCRLRFIISTHNFSSFTQSFIHKNCFELFLFAYFLF